MYQIWVTATLTSDLVFRIIVSGAYPGVSLTFLASGYQGEVGR